LAGDVEGGEDEDHPLFLVLSIISNSPLSCVGVCSRYTASFVLDLDDIIAEVKGNCSS
jgi:hypothetical protein